jgi:hypothetical protein
MNPNRVFFYINNGTHNGFNFVLNFRNYLGGARFARTKRGECGSFFGFAEK